MLTYSDNAAANAHRALLRRLDVRRLGARERDDAVDRPRRHGDVRRLRARAVGEPSRVLAGGDPAAGRQPALAGGRARGRAPTTSRACCAASGSRAAGAARSAPPSPGSRAADARYLLYLLAHVRDPGKIDREVGRLAGRPRAPQGRLDQRRPPRQRHRPLAGRRARRDRDDATARPAPGSRRTCSRAGRRGRAAPLPRLSRTPRRTRWAPASGRPSLLAVTPSECAAARRCPAPGGDIRESGLRELRLCALCQGLYAFRKHSPAVRAGARQREYRYSFCS